MPRSGMVAPPNGLAAEGGIVFPPVGYDWNRSSAVSAGGKSSAIPFYTDVHFAIRYPLLEVCEAALHTTSLLRWLGELRCGVLQERRGHPLSIAISSALGADISVPAMRGPLSDQKTVPNGRFGIDASVTAGNLITLIGDVYLSTGSEVRPALAGASPTDASGTMVRNEVRLVVPFGIGIDVSRDDEGNVGRVVIGAVPFFVLSPGPSNIVADTGIAATFGMEFAGTKFPK